MILLTDQSIVCPFTINEELVSLSLDITSRHFENLEKHLAIYNWMQQNIKYDYDGMMRIDNNLPRPYKTSLETFYTKTGNCAEMAFLYIVMARSCSLDSRFVFVEVDFRGEKVCHACAVSLGKLIDPAYETFDINHKKYTVMNDLDASNIFSEMNERQGIPRSNQKVFIDKK